MKTRPKTSLCPAGGSGGFTVVELLMVVAIVTMVLVVLLPALGAFFDSARGPNARNLMSVNLTLARNYAVANNVSTALVSAEDDVDGGMLMFLAEQDVAALKEDPPRTVFRPVSGYQTTHFPENIVVVPQDPDDEEEPDFDADAAVVCFLPTGQLTQISGPNNIDEIELPGELSPVGDVDAVKSLYIFDSTRGDDPEEDWEQLHHLYINYYTGAVIE